MWKRASEQAVPPPWAVPSKLVDKVSREITLTADQPVYGGYTLGRISKKPGAKIVLIKGAIPGETVKISIDEEKKDYYLASVVQVIEPSPFRIEPKYKPCPGCQLEYIDYSKQVEIKEQVIADSLRRIGGIEMMLSDPLVLEDNTWGYRYRAQFKVASGRIGFYKEKTREIIDMDFSPLMIDEINQALRKIHDSIHARPESFNNIVEIHLSYGGGVFALVKTKPKLKLKEDLLKKLAALFLDCGFAGIYMKAGGKKPLKYGEDFLSLNLDGITYTISPTSFFQANWKLNQVLVEFIRDRLQPLENKRVLDLFAGAGNFSLPIAMDAGEVIAIEENQSSVEDGSRNVQLNGAENMNILRMPAETYNIAGNGPFDIVIVDPPRSGLSEKLIDNILKAKPGSIVYVSCNPSTLARDLRRLTKSYAIESARLVDLFPQTYHIETLVFLYG